MQTVSGTNRNMALGATPWAQGTNRVHFPAACKHQDHLLHSRVATVALTSHLEGKVLWKEPASPSTFGHEEEEEQDAGRDLRGDPKNKDVVHVHLMHLSTYTCLEYSLVLPSLSPSATLLDAPLWVLCQIFRPQRLRPSNKQLTLRSLGSAECPRRSAGGTMGTGGQHHHPAPEVRDGFPEEGIFVLSRIY